MGYDEATSHGVRNSSGEQFAVLLESSGTINLLQQLPLARCVLTLTCMHTHKCTHTRTSTYIHEERIPDIEQHLE